MKHLGIQLGFQEIRILSASSICLSDSDCTMKSATTLYPELVHTLIKNKDRLYRGVH